MRIAENIEGKRFGKWTVLEYADRKGPKGYVIYWLCRCDCGVERVVNGPSLKIGSSKSCGCDRDAKTSKRFKKHGLCKDQLYLTWMAMLRRCNGKNTKAYKHYGARGIKVCERWAEDFMEFYNDMCPTWSKGLTIERIDVNGNYEPTNCKWIPAKEQAKNRTSARIIDTLYGPMALGDAANIAGVSRCAMEHRVRAAWSHDRLFLPSSNVAKADAYL